VRRARGRPSTLYATLLTLASRPIMHGLCTLAHAVRHVVAACAGGDPGAVRSVKARMAAPVFPGDTVVTRMWREGVGVGGRERVVFAVGVEGREGDAITAAAVELGPPLADARL